MEQKLSFRHIKRISVFVVFLAFFLACFMLCYDYGFFRVEQPPQDDIPQWIDVDYITVDGASRRGVKLEGVRDIAVHYIGNPGTGARANRNWYENPQSEVSSHFIVGLEGEIILCVPLDEKSSATNERNRDTISVEVCHPDETGEFLPATYDSLIRLLDWLCERYDLKEENIIRHYDVTGKRCPLYYVNHEDAWEKLKQDVKNYQGEAV